MYIKDEVFNLDKRRRLEALLKENIPLNKICLLINKTPKTLQCEVAHGEKDGFYSADHADEKARNRVKKGKLTPLEYQTIKELYLAGKGPLEIAVFLNRSFDTISSLIYKSKNGFYSKSKLENTQLNLFEIKQKTEESLTERIISLEMQMSIVIEQLNKLTKANT